MVALGAGGDPDIERFADDAVAYFGHSLTAAQMVVREELDQLQLAALKLRVDQLYLSVPMLKKLADRQHFDGITVVEDVIPLLFEHTMYKSYPPFLLENGRFDLLTAWLDKLTAHDLSGVDARACEGIGDWIQMLDAETPLNVNHSSGTSGLMSFNPIAKAETDAYGRSWPVYMLQYIGDPPSAPGWVPGMHLISPTHRFGANAFIRGVDMLARHIAGSEDKVHTLYPGRLDSDVLYLAARIQAAKAKGTLASLKISPHMLAKQRDYQARRAHADADMQNFYRQISDRLAGERVFMATTWNLAYNLALDGASRGIQRIFAPDSAIISGGGAKGMVQPEGWEQAVLDFTGVPALKGTYGMSELCGSCVACRHGNFHVPPSLILFVLDPDTGLSLGRKGITSGRAAFYDLVMSSHWGGIITGDEVTAHWDGDCPCGSRTVYLAPPIGRLSEQRGGDDKITCAATAQAHAEAMDFLINFDAG